MRQRHKKEAHLASTERKLESLLKSLLPHAVQTGWNPFFNSKFDPFGEHHRWPDDQAERLLALAVAARELRSDLGLRANEGPAHAFLRACEENADTSNEHRLGLRRLAERLLGELGPG